LLMHGNADSLISFEAGKMFAKKHEHTVTFKEWHDMRHDLLNGSEKEDVFSYVMNWLSKLFVLLIL